MNRRSAFLALSTCLAACNQQALKVAVSPTVLVLSPDSGSLFVGQTIALQAFTAINNNTTAKVTATQVTWTSSDVQALTVSPAGVVTGAGVGTGVKVTAVWSGLTATATFNVSGAKLKSLSLQPNPLQAAVGQTVDLSLQGTLSDGSTVDLTQGVVGTTYSSANPSVVTVSANGVTTGVAVGGPITITATNAGQSATTSALITAHPVTLTSLELSPGWQTIDVGATGAITLTAGYSDGTSVNVTGEAGTTWSTSDPTLLTAGAGGVLTALGPGSDVAVVADYSGLRATAAVDVVGSTLVSIAIQPGTVSLPLGGTAPLSVIGSYSDGHTADITSADGLTWTSSAPTTVSLSGSTVTGAMAGGPVIVTAQLGMLSATASVTVLPVSLTSLTVAPATGSVPLRGALQLTVTGVLSNGMSIDLTASGSGTTYTSGAVAAVSVSADGLAEGLQVSGPVSVTATNSGKTAVAQLSVAAGADQIVGLAITPATSRLTVQQTLPLLVTATYGDGHTANVTAASTGTVYSSSNPGVASVGTNGDVTGLADGSVEITAANSGAFASASIGVGPPAGTATGLSVTPATIQGDAGTTTQLAVTGVFSDGVTQNLTGAFTGTVYSISGNPAVASVSTNGLVTLLSGGDCVVLIQNGSVQTTVSVTVNAPTLIHLTVAPNNLQIPVGFIAQLTVTGIFSDGSTRDLTSSTTGTAYGAQTQGGHFNPNPATAVSVSADGAVTALATGRGVVNVASNGLTASVRVNVVTGTVGGVSASAASVSIPVGLTTQLTCNASLSGGQVINVTSPADGTQWVSGNASIVSVSADGLATGVAPGMATITCLNNGKAAPVTMTVTPVVAESVTVTPTSTSLPVGRPLALVVSVLFSNGMTTDVSSAPGTTYISSDNSAVVVSSTGVVTGLTSGASATITVLVAGQTATVTIQVTPPVVQSITLVPMDVSTVVGVATPLTVMGVFSDGSTMEVTPMTGLVFSASDPTIATVDANGLVTGVAVGTSTVYAFVAGLSAFATVSVTAPMPG